MYTTRSLHCHGLCTATFLTQLCAIHCQPYSVYSHVMYTTCSAHRTFYVLSRSMYIHVLYSATLSNLHALYTAMFFTLSCSMHCHPCSVCNHVLYTAAFCTVQRSVHCNVLYTATFCTLHVLYNAISMHCQTRSMHCHFLYTTCLAHCHVLYTAMSCIQPRYVHYMFFTLSCSMHCQPCSVHCHIQYTARSIHLRYLYSATFCALHLPYTVMFRILPSVIHYTFHAL